MQKLPKSTRKFVNEFKPNPFLPITLAASHMPPRASRPESDRSSKTESLGRGILQEVIWGRPIFRPPHLPNPTLALEPLAARSPSFTPRPTAAR